MNILMQYKPAIVTALIVGAVLTIIMVFTREKPPVPLVDYYASRTTPYQAPVKRDMLEKNAERAAVAVAADIPEPVANKTGGLILSGAGMIAGKRLPLEHSCYRSNKSPALSWAGMPPATKSFVVMFEDDPADKKTSLYWSVYNIPASLSALPQALPMGSAVDGIGLQGKNLTGNTGFTGPCLPKGQFPFVFRIYALDTMLNIPAGADRAALAVAMRDHIIDQAALPLIHYYKF